MKPEVVAGAFVLFGVLPLAAFGLSRTLSTTQGARRAILLVALALFAVGTWALVAGRKLGFFQGFELTLFGVTSYAVAHLVVAGVVERWVADRPGWAERPVVLRRGVGFGLILVAHVTVVLWPQID